MKSRAFCFTLFATITISAVSALPAEAQRARAFVSVNGNDANPCTALSPCRTFQAAHDAVLPSGEISVLDTGGYQPLTITKAISIVAVGIEASIATPSGVNAITINAGPTDKVSLRGLTLDGAGLGLNGILFNSGQSLTVEDSVVRNMTNEGLAFVSTSTTMQTLAVSNSYFNDNADNAIFIQTGSSGVIMASIDRTGLFGNAGAGFFAFGGDGAGPISVAMTDSTAANNAFGFAVESAAGHSLTNLSLTHSLAEGNGIGVQAFGTNAALWLAQSTVTGNGTGYDAVSGGTIASYGDNYLAAGNGGNSGTLSSASTQ